LVGSEEATGKVRWLLPRLNLAASDEEISSCSFVSFVVNFRLRTQARLRQFAAPSRRSRRWPTARVPKLRTTIWLLPPHKNSGSAFLRTSEPLCSSARKT